MKSKIFVMMCAASLLAASACQKQETPGAERLGDVTLTVSLPEGSVLPVRSGSYDGADVSRCVMEVYYNGNMVLHREAEMISGAPVVFDGFRLVASQSYDFVFWADCGEDSYDISQGLAAVRQNSGEANDASDAFCGTMMDQSIGAGGFSASLTLTRPFALVTLTDSDGNVPSDFSVGYSAPVVFNVLNDTAVETGVRSIRGLSGGNEIGSFFIWVPDGAENQVKFSVSRGQADEKEFSVPVRRNMKTNVTVNI